MDASVPLRGLFICCGFEESKKNKKKKRKRQNK
jgi:hypothetical protein